MTPEEIKRYLVPVYYVLAGANDKALAFSASR